MTFNKTKPEESWLETTVSALSAGLQTLDTGQLAALRRLAVGGPGCGPFWDLAARADFIDDTARVEGWMRLVKIMALLTPKGERNKTTPLHKPEQRLGKVLCDGGTSGWEGSPPRPFLSEARLARLLAQPAGQRGLALERIARALAGHMQEGNGVNCVDIAALLLLPDPTHTKRDLARAYYKRLDAAARSPSPTPEPRP
ncbi:hypothetical protein [Pararhodospirillum oryzae]|uniref:Type I-E CRISPR-associated protein Cse2/CasB n=1 Tax=Pararhodospirillum oryzae TaxID=478448 RepID=A0A512H969_9PROT|nr:hypothetical protein [Pararhodospirillum oryzae]GEO82007.1 hypothetical protein ROR02_21380 [Pararhodospirillum oryzae]